MTDAMAGGSGIVVLLQFGDDQQRGDFGFLGMLPAMNITEPYSPSARANARQSR